ncbi:unnamed protein product, partial [Pylaiella littoralis]
MIAALRQHCPERAKVLPHSVFSDLISRSPSLRKGWVFRMLIYTRCFTFSSFTSSASLRTSLLSLPLSGPRWDRSPSKVAPTSSRRAGRYEQKLCGVFSFFGQEEGKARQGHKSTPLQSSSAAGGGEWQRLVVSHHAGLRATTTTGRSEKHSRALYRT